MMADESHFRNKLLRKRNIMEYQIISDGSCDLDIDTLKKYNIHTVPFYVSFDGEKYDKEIQEIEIRDVYERMVTESFRIGGRYVIYWSRFRNFIGKASFDERRRYCSEDCFKRILT